MVRPPLRRSAAEVPSDLPGQAPRPAVLQVAPGMDVPDMAATTRGLIGRIDALRSTSDSLADRAAVEEAWSAGTVAGEAEPGAQMDGGGVLYRSAFNRAAADAGQRRLELAARERLAALAEEHSAAPDGFNAAAASYRDGVARGLPPQIRAGFLQRFDAAAIPVAASVRDGARRRVADDALATFAEAYPHRVAAIERAAGRSAFDPAAAEALRVEEANHLAQLVALGPREAFRIGPRQYPADPSRAGALSALDVAQRVQQMESTRELAMTVGAWRAAGGGARWIDDFQRNAESPAVAGVVQRAAADGRALAGVDRLVARLPEDWRPIVAAAARESGLPPELLGAVIGLESGGRAAAVSRAGAVGPAQIMPATARDPGLGMQPLPTEALTDPARAVPWAAQYLARLRDRYQGDMGLALAAYNWGMANVDRTLASDGRMPQETRDYLATLLPAAGSIAPGLPAQQVQRIVAHLRSLHAADEQTRAEGRAEARAEINRITTENLAAIAVAGEPTRPLDPGLAARAGIAIEDIEERERAARAAFVAARAARDTTDPAALAALAAEFAPGTANFSADPRAASPLLQALQQRGVTVAQADVAERVRDLAAEAEATGQLVALSEADARAAGLPPERRDEINRDLARRADLARLRSDAMAMPEAERAARLAELRIEGPGAAANAERARTLAAALADRDRAIREDPALYAMTGLPRAARSLAGRAAAGETDALRDLSAMLLAEQERLGVPAGERRALPRTMTDGLLARVLDAPGPDEALGALSALTGAVGVPEAARLIAAVRVSGDAQEPRRRAVAVAAAMLDERPMLARRILAGATWLRDNPVPGSGAEAAREADAALGEALALRGNTLADVRAAALALYASRRDLSPQVFNARAYREALRELAPTTRFGGRETALPPGMDEDRFATLMAALPPERLEGARAAVGRPVTPEMIARGGFQAVVIAPGRYVLSYGAYEVADAARPGLRFVLDLNGAAPAAGARPEPRRGTLRGGARRIEGFDEAVP